MTYQLITCHNAHAFTPGRNGQCVKYIVIHWWDDPAKHPSFEGVIRWFESPAAGTSAHYVAEAGRVACLVAESDTAYHAGNWDTNCQSIGIECNPRASQADLETIRELIDDLHTRYPAAQIICHSDVIPTGCPGVYRNHLNYLRKGGTPTPQAPNRPGLKVDGWCGRFTVTAWQKALGTPADGVISSQPAQYREHFPAFVDCIEWATTPQGSTMVAALQRKLNLTPTGIFDPHTIATLQKHLGVTTDGYAGYQTVTALQKRLNQGTL